MSESDATPTAILLDQGMPAGAAQLFRNLGYECSHGSELGMQKSEDEDILFFAWHHGWTVVTLDGDFHALLAVRGLSSPML